MDNIITHLGKLSFLCQRVLIVYRFLFRDENSCPLCSVIVETYLTWTCVGCVFHYSHCKFMHASEVLCLENSVSLESSITFCSDSSLFSLPYRFPEIWRESTVEDILFETEYSEVSLRTLPSCKSPCYSKSSKEKFLW